MPKADTSLKRSVSIQIYLKEGIADEELLLRVWELSQRKGKARGQNLFRSLLSAGLMAMTENGQMPEEIVEALNLELLVDKKIRRRRRIEEARNLQPPVQAPPQAYYPPVYHQPHYPPAHMPQQMYPQQPLETQDSVGRGPAPQDTTRLQASEQISVRPSNSSLGPTQAKEATKTSDTIAADRPSVNNETDEQGNTGKNRFLDLM
jgi:hypothetical protein